MKPKDIGAIVSRNECTDAAVLVVVCSCAIAMATPVAVFTSVGKAARKGVLLRGGVALEPLARADMLVMDKTVTFTFGQPRVTDIISANSLPEAEVLRIAAATERCSEPPFAWASKLMARFSKISPSPSCTMSSTSDWQP